MRASHVSDAVKAGALPSATYSNRRRLPSKLHLHCWPADTSDIEKTGRPAVASELTHNALDSPEQIALLLSALMQKPS